MRIKIKPIFFVGIFAIVLSQLSFASETKEQEATKDKAAPYTFDTLIG